MNPYLLLLGCWENINNPAKFIDRQNGNKVFTALDKQIRFESKVKTQNGEIKVVDISVALFETYQQTSSYLIATMRDISDRKRNEAKLRQLALHDELTGLSNRNSLRESISGLVQKEQHFTGIEHVDIKFFSFISVDITLLINKLVVISL